MSFSPSIIIGKSTKKSLKIFFLRCHALHSIFKNNLLLCENFWNFKLVFECNEKKKKTFSKTLKIICKISTKSVKLELK